MQDLLHVAVERTAILFNFSLSLILQSLDPLELKINSYCICKKVHRKIECKHKCEIHE